MTDLNYTAHMHLLDGERKKKNKKHCSAVMDGKKNTHTRKERDKGGKIHGGGSMIHTETC